MHKVNRPLAAFALATLIAVLVVPAHRATPSVGGDEPDPSCPAPTVAQGGQCVLRGDAVLTDTLRLPSDTKLNCKGHRLTPAASGAHDDPRTVANEFQPSQPELAILLHRSYGTEVQNCRIEGFDFGVLLAENKMPEGESNAPAIKLLANTIDVRTNAVYLIKTDNAHIADNQLTYASERGRGVVVEMDSDHNRVVNNTITSTDAASTGQVRVLPGANFVPDTQTAIMDNEVHLLIQNRPLQNIIVGGALIQVAVGVMDPAVSFEDSTRTDHNLVEGNTIIDLGVGASCLRDPAVACLANSDCPTGKGPCLLKQNTGVGFNVRAADTAVVGNSISGRMGRGINFGGVGTTFTVSVFFPGTCNLDSTRRCLDNSDCNLQGFDLTNKGLCTGMAPLTYNGNTVRLVAEGNTLAGTFDATAMFANNVDDFTFRGNLVEGGGATVTGIDLQGTALNGVVQRNAVNGVGNALSLSRPTALSWAISLNDFTGYTTAVRTTNDYNLPTDLGGNYWGLPCPGFDPLVVRYLNGMVNPFVTDTHAYGVPVANAPDDQLPAPCQ